MERHPDSASSPGFRADPPQRRPRPRRNWLHRLVNVAVAIVVLAVAAGTFVLSYPGVHAIALQGGVSGQLARFYPGSVRRRAGDRLRGRRHAQGRALVGAVLGVAGGHRRPRRDRGHRRAARRELRAAAAADRGRGRGGPGGGRPARLQPVPDHAAPVPSAAAEAGGGQAPPPAAVRPARPRQPTAPMMFSTVDTVPGAGRGRGAPSARAAHRAARRPRRRPTGPPATRTPTPDAPRTGHSRTREQTAPSPEAQPRPGRRRRRQRRTRRTRRRGARARRTSRRDARASADPADTEADEAARRRDDPTAERRRPRPSQPETAAGAPPRRQTAGDATGRGPAEPDSPTAQSPRRPAPTPQAIRYASSAAAEQFANEDWEAEVDPALAGQVYPVLTSDPDIEVPPHQPGQSQDLEDDAPPFATAPFASVPRLNRVRVTPTPPTDDAGRRSNRPRGSTQAGRGRWPSRPPPRPGR